MAGLGTSDGIANGCRAASESQCKKQDDNQLWAVVNHPAHHNIHLLGNVVTVVS
jgi:hypothetical protein